MPERRTCQLTVADAEAVNALRLGGYSAAGEFDLIDADLILWDEQDEQGIALGVWDCGTLVSTLRGVKVTNRVGAEDIFCCTIDIPEQFYPVLMLGRGATLSSHRRLGLNALLRLHLLRWAVTAPAGSDGPVGASLVMPYEGAPRVRLMEQLGYRYHRPAKVWDPEMRGHQGPLIGVLERSDFAGAIGQLESLTRTVGTEYPWWGRPPALPAGRSTPVPGTGSPAAP